MPPPRLILHIGTHKTGTTSIQGWMSWLDDQGRLPFCYAKTRGPAFAHHAICDAIADHGDVTPWLALLRECVHSDAPFVLASAEKFSRLSPLEIDDLLAEARRLGVEVSAIVFLRAPVPYLTSVFCQHVKSGASPWTFFASHNQPFKHVDSMLDRLAHWAACLGPERFQLQPFEPGQWPEKSLWAAWWHALGIAPPMPESALPDILRRRNLSPSWLSLVAVHHLEKALAQRRAVIGPGHQFEERITLPVENRLRALGGNAPRFARPPRFLDAATRAQLHARTMPRIDDLARSLGQNPPFFRFENESTTTDNDLAWFDNPYNESLPAEERAMAAHLIDFAESLVAIEMEKQDGAVSVPDWIV